MSLFAWIAGAEAVLATRVAIVSFRRADRWIARSKRWREEAVRLDGILAIEREANLLSNHLHRRPDVAGEEEIVPTG